MVYVELVPNSGQLRFINAGHLPPILINSDGISELMKGEPALGLMESFKYTERSLNLNSGDIFIAYSDGVTEAQNEREEFFGTERILKFLPKIQNLNAEKIGQEIVEEVDYFIGNAPSSDDLSLIILKRL
jgi:sigma-B regulation protein RsbU (phosphoserine phosphatase)